VAFSVQERERVRERLLERADADVRVVAAAVVGAEAHGAADRWSDLDLTFGVADGASIADVLTDWTRDLAAELDAVELFDLHLGSTIYRVFLLPGNLQIDLSFTPEADFGALGPHFRLLFGTAVERPASHPATARQLFGLGVHHAVRARFCIERDRAWQAEYWISGVRDQALALACLRRGLQTAYGRGFDRLPADLLSKMEPALVRALERSELLRALAVAVEALLQHADEAREIADKLEPQLRQLTSTTFGRSDEAQPGS
jgi:hypothetical protein